MGVSCARSARSLCVAAQKGRAYAEAISIASADLYPSCLCTLHVRVADGSAMARQTAQRAAHTILHESSCHCWFLGDLSPGLGGDTLLVYLWVRDGLFPWF